MPTVRYQIRNEYGLADPELHRAADKDDPEAILEGVAMAGLVGVLRQLGDLAEYAPLFSFCFPWGWGSACASSRFRVSEWWFAAEIFRDLHEEVMGTAARGHGLMLRVQQLEAELPSVEKAIFSQSSHSNFAYNDGIDWHSNIQMDQNLITQGDMPRFILDSYEECHGPPRLFTLDKFDTAGAGACLKRYSDPSFFKMELVPSGLVETEIPREKKSRKMRARYSEKKGSNWKKGQTLESLLSPLADSTSQTTVSDQVSSKSATRLVRLRYRNSNNTNGSKGCNLRKCLLALHSDEQKVVLDNRRRHSSLNIKLVDSGELTSVMHDTVMDVSANYPLVRDVSATETPTKEVVKLTYKFDHWKVGTEEFSEALHGPLGDMQNPQRNFNFVENKEKFADAENKSESSNCDGELSGTEKTTSVQVVDHKLVDVEHKLEDSNNGYKTEDGGSEQENFMDALNSMEPEVETDSENKDRPDLGVTKKEAYDMNFYTSETLDELLTQFSKQDMAAVSIVSIGLNHNLESGISSNLCNLSETPATQEKEIISNSSANSEYFLGETNDENCEERLSDDQVANSFDMISDGTSDIKSFDNPILRLEVREEPCNSCDINSTSNLISTDPHQGFDALQFVKAYQVGTSADHEAQLGRDETIKCSDGSPHSNRSYYEIRHPPELVEELVLEGITEMLDMPNHLSSSLARTLPMEDHGNEGSPFITAPTEKEMQDSMDQGTKAFASKNDTTASLGGRSIITTAPHFDPDISINVQHDVASDINICQYPEESTIETSSDYLKGTDDAEYPEESTVEISSEYVKGTDGVVQTMNGPSVGSKDDIISENPHLPCNPVELILEEMASASDISDYLSESKYESSLAEVFEVPSNASIEKSPQLTDHDAEVCSTESTPVPIPAIVTITDKDCTEKLENIDAENLEVGCDDTDDMTKNNLVMPEIPQPQLEHFSGTDETLQSPKVKLAEPQESHKTNSTEQVPLCAESETFLDRIINSPVLVGDSLKLANEFIQENLQSDVQGFEQITDVKDMSAENFASEDETNSYDSSLVYTQESSGLPQQLVEDSIDSAVSYQHQMKIHETFSPKMAKSLDSQSTADMTVFSGVEQSAQDPVASHGLPVEDSSDANDDGLHGDTCDTMPNVHVHGNLHPFVNDTCLEYPVESKQDFSSKCLEQGHHESAKQEMSLSANLLLDHASASLPEEAFTLQASNEVELESLHQKGEYFELDIPIDSVDADEEPSEGPEPNHHAFMSNVKCDELDIAPSSTTMTEKLGSALVSSECCSEISACQMASNVSDVTFSLSPSSVVFVTESTSILSSELQSDESTSCFPSQNSEEPPPLPPLPPLQWRTQKIQVSSLLPNANSSASLAVTNPFVTPSDMKPANKLITSQSGLSELPPIVVDQSHQPDAQCLEGNLVHSSNSLSLISSSLVYEKNIHAPEAQEGLRLPLADSFTPLPISESPISQHSALQEEKVWPVPDMRFHQPDAQCLEGNLVHSSNSLSLISSSLVYEKNMHASEAQEELRLPLADSFTALPILESQISQQEEKVQPVPDNRFQISQLWPGSDLEKSHYSEQNYLNLETEAIQPQNLFLFESTLEDYNHHRNHGDFGGDNAHLLKSSDLSLFSRLEMPQPGYVYSLEGSHSMPFGVVPTREDEWLSIKPRSIRNRPRNPLIEAVAAHDRSTLRKVPEQAKPSNESKVDKKDAVLESNILQLRKVSEHMKPSNKPKADERDELLEQIRNKSFSLKPAVLSKPNNKGHSTNIKVAAILEKANALRQAMVGSDEEDGGDGLPSTHFVYVRNIEEGLPLFLFNYSDRKLHGIFEAASHGQLNTNSYAWTDGSNKRTPFPAQVSIRIKTNCVPLTENQFKKIIEDNYYNPQHFWFELDHAQTSALIAHFVPLPSHTNTRADRLALPASTTTFSKETSSSRCTYAEACVSKKDFDMPVNLVDKNNFLSLSCGDEDSNHGVSSKTSCSAIEDMENVETVSDWEEWAVENMQVMNVDASTCMDPEHKLQEHEVGNEASEPQVETVLLNLRRMPADSQCSTQSANDCRDNIISGEMEEYAEQVLGRYTASAEKEDDETIPKPFHENNELMQVICELKARAENLEKKQVESDREMQRLRDLVVDSGRRMQQLNNCVKELESKIGPSVALDDSMKKFVEERLGSEDVIYIIGGFNGFSCLSALDSFSPSLDSLTPLECMNYARSYASAVALDGNIYVFGGGDGTSWYDTVERYNPRNDEWVLCPPLIHKKGSLAGSTLNSKIYAIGGGDGVQCFSNVEMFDPALGRWINSQSMLMKRFAPAATELQGVIYACGGYSGHEYLKSAERFDPREGHWTKMADMNRPRGCHSAAALKGKLYAIGGYDGEEMVSSVEAYEPRMSSWAMVEPMKAVRGYAATTVLGGSIYVIGGVKDGRVVLDTVMLCLLLPSPCFRVPSVKRSDIRWQVECYREESGWRETGLKAVGRRCFCSAIVI
ncbi:hypothetical protein MUK42_21290 [Musa troglodytarum]|uniref:Protein SCAR n=1 Tax=Musa troglodytarum TaxID=320322 RepID=A0A9E7K986_9LILI|nr:hypothetical protein MUK42_21290 [Musa troglodytarum]